MKEEYHRNMRRNRKNTIREFDDEGWKVSVSSCVRSLVGDAFSLLHNNLHLSR